MKKIISVILLTLLSLCAFADESTLDDAISEKLAPLLSNYIGDHEAQFEAVLVTMVTPDLSNRTPVLLVPPVSLESDSLQDCEEKSSSLVCRLAQNIETFLKNGGITKGKIILDIKVFKDKKFVKEFKDVEVLSF